MIVVQTALLLRLIHSSDTHGWLYGSVHNQTNNATFGDILTFIQNNKERYRGEVLAFDSGDFVQGCGLSDATDPVGYFVNDMWKKQFQSGLFYDYITIGNHDIREGSVEYFIDEILSDKTVRNRTVSLNVLNDKKPMGVKFGYTTLGNMSVLVSGMLYEMSLSGRISIEKISRALEDEEFQQGIQNADMVVMLVHIGMSQSVAQYYAIYEAIRAVTPAPVIIMGGHEHQTNYTYPVHDKYFYNPYPFLLNAAGNDTNLVFMETKNYFKELSLLDFNVTFDEEHDCYLLRNVQRTLVPVNTASLNVSELTPAAAEIEGLIQEQIKILQLRDVVGIAPQDYYTPYDKNISLNDTQNIYNLMLFHIVPDVLYSAAPPVDEPVFIQGSSFFGTQIYQGPVTVDDLYITSPYKEEIYYSYSGVSGADLKRLLKEMNGSGGSTPRFYVSHTMAELKENSYYSIVLNSYDDSKMQKSLTKLDMTLSRDGDRYTDYNAFSLYQAFVQTHWAPDELTV